MSEKEYVIDSDENSDYIVDIITDIIDKAGPRPPCSEEEKKAAELFAEELDKYCDSVDIEPFEHYPQLSSADSWQRRVILIDLISAMVFFFYLFNGIIFSALALGISFFGLVTVYFGYLKGLQWTPKIFPYKPKESRNVVGVIKPTGEVKKRVMFGGHIDSAHRFNWLQHTHEAYIYLIIGGIVTFFVFPIMHVRQLLISIFGATGTTLSIFFNWLAILMPMGIGIYFMIVDVIAVKLKLKSGWVFWGSLSKISTRAILFIVGIIAYQILVSVLLFNFIMVNPETWKTTILVILEYAPFMLGFIFFASRDGVPGAMDNLSACAIATCAAKILKEWKTNYPHLFPKNTEVVIALFGSEESGCNGAAAFAEKHVDEYNQIDTTCVNMDTIADPEVVMIISRETSIRVPFDPGTYNLLAESAEELKINYEVRPQPWATGGSDASRLMQGGIKASSLIGLHIPHYLHYYHTDRDDAFIINKERRPCTDHGTDWNNRNMRCAMENALKICLKYLEKKDKQ